MVYEFEDGQKIYLFDSTNKDDLKYFQGVHIYELIAVLELKINSLDGVPKRKKAVSIALLNKILNILNRE